MFSGVDPPASATCGQRPGNAVQNFASTPASMCTIMTSTLHPLQVRSDHRRKCHPDAPLHWLGRYEFRVVDTLGLVKSPSYRAAFILPPTSVLAGLPLKTSLVTSTILPFGRLAALQTPPAISCPSRDRAPLAFLGIRETLELRAENWTPYHLGMSYCPCLPSRVMRRFTRTRTDAFDAS